MITKIMVTGGHHTPALALISCLESRLSSAQLPPVRIFWLGHKHSMWGDRSISAEYQEVTARGYTFFDLKAGKFFRTFHPLKLMRIPFGFFQSFFLLLKIRPALVISFGGYLAVPVVFSAWILRVPVVMHEQTAAVGLAGRFVAVFAERIFISFESSRSFLPSSKTVLVGNLVRPEIFLDKGLYRFRDRRRTIYVTGGKQGSHFINQLILNVLEELLAEFNLIHQCGRSTVSNDSEKLQEKFRQLTEKQRSGYVLKDYFDRDEVGSVLARCDLAVSRAGANAIYEFGLLAKPAVLIPISWSSRGEQLIHAKILENYGSAVILDEKVAEGRDLLSAVREISRNYSRFRERAEAAKLKFPLNGALRMTEEILVLLGKSGDNHT